MKSIALQACTARVARRTAVVVRAQSQESTSRRAVLGFVATGEPHWGCRRDSSPL